MVRISGETMGSSKALESRGGRFRRAVVFLVALLLLVVQLGAVRGESEANDEDWRIESVLEQRNDAQPWHFRLGRVAGKFWGNGDGEGCEEPYGVLPCSVTLGGSAALVVVYGHILYKSAMLMSDGSELLLGVMSPGILGGLVLPVLGAAPDAWLIAVSGLGGSQAEAQEQVLVGMGLVAGSCVLLLTALWGSCLIVGRCDLVKNLCWKTRRTVAKDKTLTKGWSLTGTGITADEQTKWASRIMIATLVPYVVAQIPRLLGLKTEGHAFIAVAAVLAVLGLIGYCTYQIAAPWISKKRIEFARKRYRRSHSFYRASYFARSQGWGSLFKANGEPDEAVLMRLFDHFDQEEPKDGHLTKPELKALILGLDVKRHNGEIPDEDEVKQWMEEFDTSHDGMISKEEFLTGIMKWMKRSPSRKLKDPSAHSGKSHSRLWDREAQVAKQQLSSLLDEPSDDDDDDDDDKKPPSRAQVITTAVCYLCAGAAVAFIFADPFVEAIGAFSKASGIPPFFISFIVTPLACSSSEAVSSLIFAKKKRKRTISMTYSQIYGAVTMKNTMCLGVFLAIVYSRQLVWDFSAEVVVIFFATLIMGCLAAFRTTFPLWMAYIGLALYPLSIVLVVFLDYVCGWH